MADRRAVVRALVLAFVLAVHACAAAPIPHAVTKDDLLNPTSREEVARWAVRLSALGYAVTPEALGEQVIAVTGAISAVHRTLLAPARPVFRWTGTGQGWALFVNPDTHPSRLQIRARRGEDWEVLFQRLDPEHAWSADVLSFRRVRGCYDAGGYRDRPRGVYRRFAEWVGRRILEQDPTVDLVEVRSLRTHTTVPPDPPDDRVEVRHVVPIRRRP